MEMKESRSPQAVSEGRRAVPKLAGGPGSVETDARKKESAAAVLSAALTGGSSQKAAAERRRERVVATREERLAWGLGPPDVL